MSDHLSFVIHPELPHQTIKDFGASACWWPDNGALGTPPFASRFLDLIYSKEGLDFNVIRLNIGGSVKDDKSDAFVGGSQKASAPYSPLKEDGSYDIRRDKGYWQIVELARKIPSITDFTLFMNSPPATMTKNGRTATSPGEFNSNLRDDCYEAYAQYTADITELYIREGIPVKYVSPINEPQWCWNEQRQEGCHYEPQECVRLWKLLIKAFRERAARTPAMDQVRISVPETAQWYQRTYVHDLYTVMHNDPEIAPWVDHFAAHSYGTTREQKIEFRSFVDSLGEPFIPLHQTESAPLLRDGADSMDYALEVATTMYEDFSILHVDHWTWWTIIGEFVWPSGLICIKSDGSKMTLSKRYFVVKHYSKFIRDKVNVDVERTGSSKEVDASAYTSKDGKEMVVILVNRENEPQKAELVGVPEGLRPMVYETSETRDCQYLGRILFDGSVSLPPRSITNLVFTEE